ncbi:hypothetical protein [Burkholderia ubonensis]|uniref:hypothetical protein n=1 Tax=Burkholderia ubonensis TaxID=101571 RepID=UPI00075B3FBD|nr:hypothetical protein [Burkholderia ubonensis]KVS40462.1 hypothetical protein WK37_21440 [Burkholderia ubonensis]KVS51082.1 hypothetical protein WK38_12390 [Burkholderia ubonensis]KVS76088.1 hypothetical protein WK42_18035 [Burkholderia ubonensis]KVS78326.1 hypothetical protein WK43_02275 [Burkholderia ubonensis]KVS82230.1 hypothetical protein WK44_25100 [Burkholderia ubonensis]
MDDQGNETSRSGARPVGMLDAEVATSSICIEVQDGVLVKWIVNANADDCPDLLRNLAMVQLEIVRKMRALESRWSHLPADFRP